MLIYDCEIKRVIPSGKEPPLEGIEYCAGWRDFAGMGISTICAYDYVEQRYRVFMDDNMEAFNQLVAKRDLVIGFSNAGFDDQLCAANDIQIPAAKSYDLLVEIWLAAGLGPTWRGPKYNGWSLGDMCQANGGPPKSGHGALAPVQYQRGQIGAVIDYCLHDIFMTKHLVDLVLSGQGLRAPERHGGGLLQLISPAERAGSHTTTGEAP